MFVGASQADSRLSIWREVGVALATGTFMALIGALGTQEAPLSVRLAFWIGLMFAGTVIGHGVTILAGRLELFEQRPWVWAVLTAILISPPLSFVVWLAVGFAFDLQQPVTSIISKFPPVLIVSLGMTSLTVLSQRRPIQTHAALPNAGPPAFLERLPDKLRGGEIYAVQAEDHYLRLHTSRGQDLILMRLADAVGELEGLEGAQVHRSWWVAKTAISTVTRGNGRASLTLTNGTVAPVSRTYARALREAGWI
jgi:LytTr DNA-binding domain